MSALRTPREAQVWAAAYGTAFARTVNANKALTALVPVTVHAVQVADLAVLALRDHQKSNPAVGEVVEEG